MVREEPSQGRVLGRTGSGVGTILCESIRFGGGS